MLEWDYGYYFTKRNKLLVKPISEIQRNNYILIVSCDICGIIFKPLSSNRRRRLEKGIGDFCKSCVMKGDKNPSFSKDRSEILRYARTFIKNFARIFSEETKIKMSESKSSQIANGTFDVKSNNRGRKNWYFSKKNNKKFYSDSALELMRMIQLDEDSSVLRWDKNHGIKIKYEYNGKTRLTIPDFIIERIEGIEIEEVKGHLKEVELIKKDAIQRYCNENGYNFVFTTQAMMNKNGEYRSFLIKLKKNEINLK